MSTDPKASVDALVENLTKRAEKLGLYLQNVTVGAADEDVAKRMADDPALMAELLRDGEQFVLVVNFSVGDLAWSDKVQNPDVYASDHEFRVMTTDAPIESFEEMKKHLQDGGPLFDD